VQITVLRDTFTNNSTTGEMSLDGTFECFTLEPRADKSEGKPYCIPAGTYLVTLEMSERFQMLTPHVQNVPDFTAIEIHPGNFASDTEGCCLVGESRGVDFVGTSRPAFEALMQKLRLGGDLTITYVGGSLPTPAS
jgi:hypothetical protein